MQAIEAKLSDRDTTEGTDESVQQHDSRFNSTPALHGEHIEN